MKNRILNLKLLTASFLTITSTLWGFTGLIDASSSTRYDYYISAGDANSYVLLQDGSTFYSTGVGGKLGSGSNLPQTSVPVAGLGSDYKMIDAGDEHTVTLKNDGTIWSFGSSAYGELGTGERIDIKKEPYQNRFIDNVQEIAAGDSFTLALKNDGTVWAYGRNNQGQLGIGNTSQFLLTPQQVPGPENIVKIDASEFNGAALDSEGFLWVWGDGHLGQLGQGDKNDQTSPVLYPIYNVIDFSVGDQSIYVVTEEGEVYASGLNTQGMLGIGGKTNPTTITSPAKVDISNVKQISTWRGHTLALKEDGTVWSWGINTYGQLGDGTTANAMQPVQVLDESYSPLNDIIAVCTSRESSLAIKSDGSILSWGRNENGDLGNGDKTDRHLPSETLFPKLF